MVLAIQSDKLAITKRLTIGVCWRVETPLVPLYFPSIPFAAKFGESGQVMAFAPDTSRRAERHQTRTGLVVAQIGLDRFVQQNFRSDSLDPAERLESITFFVGQCDLCGGHDRPFILGLAIPQWTSANSFEFRSAQKRSW